MQRRVSVDALSDVKAGDIPKREFGNTGEMPTMNNCLTKR